MHDAMDMRRSFATSRLEWNSKGPVLYYSLLDPVAELHRKNQTLGNTFWPISNLPA